MDEIEGLDELLKMPDDVLKELPRCVEWEWSQVEAQQVLPRFVRHDNWIADTLTLSTVWAPRKS